MSRMRRFVVLALVLGAIVGVNKASAVWWRLLDDDFSTAPSTWSYAGVSNAFGEALFLYDAANERIQAEWDQDNFIDAFSDPIIIENAALSRPLPRSLTDRDSFRVFATLRIEAGSIPDTTEFYQIANFGLYNMEKMGPDRTLADDLSVNENLVRNGSDFVEFNYFINNNSFGLNANITAIIGATVPDDLAHAYTTGSGSDSWYHLTDMGADNYLPEETDLYVEVAYYGAATGAVSRRAWTAIYTDAQRTNLLEVNGVPMFYWTQPLPATNTFEVTHVAFFNYVAPNWGGANGEGAGSFDDVAVQWGVSEGRIITASRDPSAFALTWAAESGTTYAVVSQTNLLGGVRTTQALVTATSEAAGWTNTASAGLDFYSIEPQ